MHFWAKLLTKRLAFNPFVSNICLRYKCCNSLSNKQFAVKKHFKSNIHLSEIQNEIHPTLWLTHSRGLSSKTNSSESHPKDIANDENQSEKALKPSMKSKFKKYSDEDSEVIYDVSEELMSASESKPQLDIIPEEWDESREETYLYQQKSKYKKAIPVEYQRGESGVFDLPELVDFLRSENLKEIAVIDVPDELDYCQYLVLANATSKRHINVGISCSYVCLSN